MKTRPSTEFVLLGTLMSGSKHGYEIMQFLESALEPTWYVSTSQLYTLLKRLEQNGLLYSSMETQSTRPSKRVFFLTNEGKKAFIDWVHRPTEHVRDFRNEFISKLFFFHNLSLEGGADLIDAQVEILEQLKNRLQERGKTEQDPFNRLVYGYKLDTVKNLIRWLSLQAVSFMDQEGNGRQGVDNFRG